MNRATRSAAVAATALAALFTLSACGDGAGPLESLGKERNAPASRESEEPGEPGEPAESEPPAGPTASLPAEEISARAQEALLSAGSLRLTASGDSDGGQLDFDLHLDRAGSCVGEAGYSGQGSFELMARGDEVWMKPDAEFWRNAVGGAEGGAAAGELTGLWLYGHGSDDPDLASLTEMCTLDELLSDMEFDTLTGGSATQVTKGDQFVHDGAPVIELHAFESARDRVTILVATQGEPYPLRIEGLSDSESFTMDLSDFDVPVEINEPPADLVLDMSELGPRGLDLQA